jgi:hypothetical protein
VGESVFDSVFVFWLKSTFFVQADFLNTYIYIYTYTAHMYNCVSIYSIQLFLISVCIYLYT